MRLSYGFFQQAGSIFSRNLIIRCSSIAGKRTLQIEFVTWFAMARTTKVIGRLIY